MTTFSFSIYPGCSGAEGGASLSLLPIENIDFALLIGGGLISSYSSSLYSSSSTLNFSRYPSAVNVG